MSIDSLSVFFPAVNEEENIEKTLTDAVKVLENLKLKKYEVIVVNDGSVDKTAQIVEKLANKNPKIKLVSHPRNLGYGGALKTGFKSAEYPWVVFADSDGQFDFSEVSKFIAVADEADLILGYRLKRMDSLIRRLGAFVWIVGAKLLFNLSVRDYSCGFKMIKKEVFEGIQPLIGEEKVTQIEMLVKAKKKKYRFKEVPVHHYPRVFGKQTGANIKVVAKSYLDLIKLWWALR